MYSISRIGKQHPFLFGVGVSAIKTSGVDLWVQLKFENRNWNEVNWRRNIFFGSFGMIYLGCVQYGIYVKLFTRMFPRTKKFAALSIREKITDKVGRTQIVKQILFDQLIHHPLLYFPCFYITKEFIQNSNSKSPIINGLSKYKNNYKTDLRELWKLWIPATCFNFFINPLWMRVPFTALVSVLWTSIVSQLRGKH